MQTLGLSDSEPRTEGRLKSLLWPSIANGADVDYLGAQGYWVCTVIAVLSFIVSTVSGGPIIGVLLLLFFYLGGIGVRERSRYAALIVLVLYVVDTLLTGLGVVRIIIGALLLSNLRATWIAAQWKPEAEEAILPPRLGETWSDKFADQLPAWLWPKLRIAYYIYSVGFLLFIGAGLLAMARRLAR
jgi:hypothetical protein